MGYIDAIILGLIQGLTEFLPVSSSGHLVLIEHLLHAKIPGVTFELMVHFGTLMSVLIYFRKRIIQLVRSLFVSGMERERMMVLYLITGTIPAVIFALLFRDLIEHAFSSPLMSSVFLVVTGLILLSTTMHKNGNKNIDIFGSLIIGLGQALAILPGISRSGTTISAGLLSGIKPVAAAEFSFLLSIPAIAGAIIFEYKEYSSINLDSIGQYAIGTILAFLSGLIAVYLLLDLIKKGKFKYFGYYCLLAGALGIYHFI